MANFKEMKTLTPFKLAVLQNFPYIEADFDALTNYGLMCKIVEYLNQIIANENAVNENVSEIINYFNNLDVQDEIDDKLDRMTQDGSLTQLIKNYIDPLYQTYEFRIDNKIEQLENDFDVVQDEVASVVSGSPAGVYPTIAALQQADPDHTRIYLVEQDGEWYFYNNNTNQWKNGGVYQATGIGENSIEPKNLNSTLRNYLGIKFPEYTLDTGHYIAANNAYQANVSYSLTNKIHLKKNETIVFNAKGSFDSSTQSGKIAVLSLNTHNVYKKLLINDVADEKTYYYTANNDIDVQISSLTNNLKNIYILTDINSMLNNLNKIDLNIKIDLPYFGYIDYRDGLFKERNDYNSSDYIDVIGGTTMIIKTDIDMVTIETGSGFCFYDKNKNFISGIRMPISNEIEINIPSNAYYIRYCFRNAVSIKEISYKNLFKELFDLIKVVTEKENDIINYDFSMFDTLGVIGDSYASGCYGNNAESTNAPEHYSHSWPQMIARKYGCDVQNFTYGGLSTRSWLLNENYGLNKLLSSSKKDIYLLVLERNDYNIEYRGETGYLGSISDITSHSLGNYPDSFYGNYATIIERILQYSPKSKLILISGDYRNDLGIQYNNAMVEIANHYNIPIIKQLDDSFFTSPLYRQHWNSGGHPGLTQYNGMMNAFERLFNKCVENNIEYFKYSGVDL